MVRDFNENRAKAIQPGMINVLDESMSAYQPRKDKLGGLPNISFIQRKPKPLGTEFKTSCDGHTGVMLHLEIQEGKDPMRLKPHSQELGVTSACSLRVAQGGTQGHAGHTVLGDSWFASVKASTAVAMKKNGLDFIGVVKQGHARYPKTFIESTLQTMPAGSRLHLESVVDGIPLIATGYKYNRKKVLCFVSTKGAAPLTDGEPYTQRWADDYGNICTRLIRRPAVCSEYFGLSPRVDNHNQARQHELALEELWDTKSCWFRLHTTLHGMHVTDAWKLCRYHLSANHPLKDISIQGFADRLAWAMLQNDLVSANQRLRARAPTVSRNPVPMSQPLPLDNSQHQIKKLPFVAATGKKKKIRQGRCRLCLLRHQVESWTSYECSLCQIPLCIPNRRHDRVCFNDHFHCTEFEVRAMRSANVATKKTRRA
eukprot:scaffold108899_cov15-Prasinocladus_malaysianus.AAC.1